MTYKVSSCPKICVAVVEKIEEKSACISHGIKSDIYSLKMNDLNGNMLESSQVLVLEVVIKPLHFQSVPIPPDSIFGKLMKQLQVQNTGEMIGKEIYLYPDYRDYFIPVTFDPSILESSVNKSNENLSKVLDIPLNKQRGRFGIIRNIKIFEKPSYKGLKRSFSLTLEDCNGNRLQCSDAWKTRKLTTYLRRDDLLTDSNSPMNQLLKYYKLSNLSGLLGKEVNIFRHNGNNWAILTFDAKLI